VRSALLSLVLLAVLPAAAAVDAGAPAPAFTGKPLAGGADLALADFRGKVVYLDFWASWCAPCGQSLPWMETLRREFAPAGFEVVAINVDETPDDGVKFLRRFKVSYPIVGDRGGDIAELYDVRDMPSSYLIDRRGVVRRVHRGFNKRVAAELRSAVAALVAEQP
jgi:cytochrome c biogenesis protein CcmG, thiol:disulfide interchange protein DsbE